jgi:predicted helicase
VRANPKLSGARHNVFGIQTGVAISFFVKRAKHQGCRIFYARRPEFEVAEDKLAFLNTAEIGALAFEEIRPDKLNNWLGESNQESLLVLADRRVKAGKSDAALFRLFCWGNSSNRDEWVYDVDARTQLSKAHYLVDTYDELLKRVDRSYPNSIKWSLDLKNKFNQGRTARFASGLLVEACWRPFSKASLYSERLFNDRLTENHYAAFGPDLRRNNEVIMVCGHPQIPFTVHAVVVLPDAGYASRATQMFPRYVYTPDGLARDNITDWSIDHFRKHYEPGRAKPKRPITKEEIFYYVYGVLHDPVYREKYAIS